MARPGKFITTKESVNKRKKEWFGTSTKPPFYWFRTPILNVDLTSGAEGSKLYIERASMRLTVNRQTD